MAVVMRSQLKEVAGARRRQLLVEFVRQEAMKTLGITGTIDAARPLRELGLNSLMSVTLVNRLEAALGIKVSTVKLIQGPSVEQLVDDILPDVTGTADRRVRHPDQTVALADGKGTMWQVIRSEARTAVSSE